MAEQWETISHDFQIKDIGAPLLNEVARFIYDPAEVIREYIQNAVDAHRLYKVKTGKYPEGQILIEIRKNKLQIMDFGIGMDLDQIEEAKGIFVSGKNRISSDYDVTLTGYKGIGIWAGINYFEKLSIETTSPGCPWMFKLEIDFANIVASIPTASYIGEALNPNFRLKKKPADLDDHKTVITLENPIKSKDIFLDKDEIKKAIRTYCPCELDENFAYFKEINEWYEQNNLSVFPILVDGERVFRYFPGNVENLRKGTIKGDNGEIGIYWVAINKDRKVFTKIQSTNSTIGIKIIHSGFQIGQPNIYSDKNLLGFEELGGRGTYPDWYIGEIHITNENIKPDMRRRNLDSTAESNDAIRAIRKFYDQEIIFQARVRTEVDSKTRDYEQAKTQVVNSQLSYKQLKDLVEQLKKDNQTVKNRSAQNSISREALSDRKLRSLREELLHLAEEQLPRQEALFKLSESTATDSGKGEPYSSKNQDDSQNHKKTSSDNNEQSTKDNKENSEQGDTETSNFQIEINIAVGILYRVLEKYITERDSISKIAAEYRKQLDEVVK
jgi:hypothetical protein